MWLVKVTNSNIIFHRDTLIWVRIPSLPLYKNQKGEIIMDFMEQLHSVLTDRKTVTENGALGYATTGKELLDLNFAVASLRNMNEREISKRFLKAYYENPQLAMKWLFFLRDIRGGLGERRSFRIILRSLIEIRVDMVRRLIPLVAEYGRFDDLLCLFDTAVESDVIEYLKEQLTQDMQRMQAATS